MRTGQGELANRRFAGRDLCREVLFSIRSQKLEVQFCVQLVYKKAVLKGLKLDLSNAESTTDS